MNTSTSQQNPYAPPTAEVSDAANTQEAFEQAERGTRFGAAIVDGLIGILVFVPVIFSMGVTELATANLGAALLSGAGFLSLIMAIAASVYTIHLVIRNGQTIGKKLLGIKVVRSDGSRASLGRIFWLRNVVNALPGVIPFVGNIYVLVDHLFIFGEKRQCLHDKIADTIVIRA
jgi:uncharacterized RDD family membrane protein YckC